LASPLTIDSTKVEGRKNSHVDVGQNEMHTVLIFGARNFSPDFLLHGD